MLLKGFPLSFLTATFQLRKFCGQSPKENESYFHRVQNLANLNTFQVWKQGKNQQIHGLRTWEVIHLEKDECLGILKVYFLKF